MPCSRGLRVLTSDHQEVLISCFLISQHVLELMSRKKRFCIALNWPTGLQHGRYSQVSLVGKASTQSTNILKGPTQNLITTLCVCAESVAIEIKSKDRGSAQGEAALRPMGLVRGPHFHFLQEERERTAKGLSPGNVN